MGITVAKSAGFCFGVQRAVDIAFEQARTGKKVCTLGPIIHNPQIVEQLKQQGVCIIDSVSKAQDEDVVIIRSHGVGQDVYTELTQRNLSYIDATCPFVAKIHKIVDKCTKDSIILIAGDRNHPEVLGIIGHCKNETIVFHSLEELTQISLIFAQFPEKNYSMVAQTTFNIAEWKKCIDFIKKECTNIKIFDTICSATTKRQSEADLLAAQSDLMIVIGGKQSSNTAKLAQICEKHCKTVLVESAEELREFCFDGITNIGVTAGASTPACIIKEVHKTMSENVKNQEELSFEEMLEQSFKTIYTREKVTAVVTQIAPNEIAVDIGTKHAGYVPLAELTEDPNVKIEDLVKIGDEIELLVLRVNDVEGTVMLSKKRLDAQAGFEKVMNAADTQEILEGVVVDVIKGGILVLTNGVKVFIPASQATASRGEALESLLKKNVTFRILEVNRQRRRAVGSIRAVLKEQRKVLEDKFWETVEVGNTYKGVVKSLTSYGAFVDLGGVDGMVHISELSWNRIKHPSDVVKEGDMLEVYIKDIDKENRKVSLGYKKTEDNPWEIVKNEYGVGTVAEVTVVSLTPFGAFAQIIPGVDGLIHISQISTERINKPEDVLAVGQKVQAKITELDLEKKRISLSVRAILEEQAAAEEAAKADEPVEEVVFEAAPPTDAE